MNDVLARADAALGAGDVPGALHLLRPVAETAPIAALAAVVERAAAAVGFDDMAAAAAAVAADERDPQALYDFGYAGIDRGVAYLSVPALAAALRELPGNLDVLTELVSALENEARHRDAVALLEDHEPQLRMWPDRYLLVVNSVLAGDIARATRHFGAVTVPDDPDWAAAYARIQLMISRIGVTRTASPLDHTDLRGWHFAINGGVLGTLSPFGFAAGMTGRWAFTQDSFGQCRHGLQRLRLVLETVGRRPRSVSLLPDRSSRILGLAAAQVLDVPAEPWSPGRTDTVVVAYDLREVDPATLQQLSRRAGQVLVEHATCWTDPPPIAADYTTLLAQHNIEPWGARLHVPSGGDAPQKTDPDTRPAELVAADILAADPTPEVGDGDAPPDSDDGLAAFAAAVAGSWPAASDSRDRMWSPGPVPSNRFA